MESGPHAGRPRGLAFAPFLFTAKISGRLGSLGDENPSKFKDKGLLTLSPGLGRMTIKMDDPDGELTLAFRGTARFRSDASL